MHMTCVKAAAAVQNDMGNPLTSNPLVRSELQTMQQLEQRRTELLLQKHQSSFEARLRADRQAADTQALIAATTQSDITNAYLAMLLRQHHVPMNPLEEIRRQQASMILQQQQMVPYAQQQQMIPNTQQNQMIAFAQQLAAAQQQQESMWADDAKGSARHQARK
jgi:hypothetical protein